MNANNPRADERVNMPTEERLYRLGWETFVQYGGTGPIPKELEDYVRDHGGTLPPYIPLPQDPVEFNLAYGPKVWWPGTGQLPESVLAHVRKHGILPQNTSDAGLVTREGDDEQAW